jgi:hypothetical protein
MSILKNAAAVAVVASIAGGVTSATADAPTKIAPGSVTARALSPGLNKTRLSDHRRIVALEAAVRKLGGNIPAAGSPGPAGAKGSDGAGGAAGSKGADGAQGAKGDAGSTGATGATGAAGADGRNPATPVKASGDAGWTLSGSPSATFERGALHLHGGFDSSTQQGAIGIVHAYSSVPLDTLSALGMSFSVNKRDTVDQPTFHVTVLGAVQGVDSKFASGFTNLVWSPAYNGIDHIREATVDAFAPGNAWYSTGNVSNGSGSQAQPISIQEFMTRNPNAAIVQISVDNGGSSSGTSAFDDTDMSVDNLTVGFGSSFDRYDFGG